MTYLGGLMASRRPQIIGLNLSRNLFGAMTLEAICDRLIPSSIVWLSLYDNPFTHLSNSGQLLCDGTTAPTITFRSFYCSIVSE